MSSPGESEVTSAADKRASEVANRAIGPPTPTAYTSSRPRLHLRGIFWRCPFVMILFIYSFATARDTAGVAPCRQDGQRLRRPGRRLTGPGRPLDRRSGQGHTRDAGSHRHLAGSFSHRDLRRDQAARHRRGDPAMGHRSEGGAEGQSRRHRRAAPWAIGGAGCRDHTGLGRPEAPGRRTDAVAASASWPRRLDLETGRIERWISGREEGRKGIAVPTGSRRCQCHRRMVVGDNGQGPGTRIGR